MISLPVQPGLHAPDVASSAAESSSPRRRFYKPFMLGLKLLVTLALVAWIIAKVDWSAFWTTLIRMPTWVLTAAVVIWFVNILLSATKWQQLLAVHDLHYPWRSLLRWHLIGRFLTQFLPSLVGGDGYRIYKTLGNGRHRACSVLAVFVERLSGMIVLLIMGTVAAIVDAAISGNTFSRDVAWAGGISWAVGLAALVVAWTTGMLPRLAQHPRCPSPVRSLIAYGSEYARHPWRLCWAAVISLAFHGLRVLVYWMFLHGIGVQVSVLGLTVVAMLIILVGMIPITLGGWGLLEGSFMFMAVFYGVPPEAGLTVMLLTRITVLPMAMVGGLLYLFEHDVTLPRRGDPPPILPLAA